MLLKKEQYQKVNNLRNKLKNYEKQRYLDLVESTKNDLNCSYKYAKKLVKEFLNKEKEKKMFLNNSKNLQKFFEKHFPKNQRNERTETNLMAIINPNLINNP